MSQNSERRCWMQSFKQMLQAQETRYEQILNRVSKATADHASDMLETKVNHGKYEYYRLSTDPTTGKKRRVYLNKSQRPEAQALAQRSYLQQVQRRASKTLKHLRSLNQTFHDDEIMNIYHHLSPGRKQLVTPIEMTAEQWKAIPYQSLSFDGVLTLHYTDRQERVRSKTEKILADRYAARNIIYKYECKLVLAPGTTLYPDFTFFNETQQQEVYWEHLGMMSDPKYRARAFQKLHLYETHGIHLGERLIVTREYEGTGFDTQWADYLIDSLLLPLLSKRPERQL